MAVKMLLTADNCSLKLSPTEQVGDVTPLPSWEPTEQPNIMENEPESKKLEEDDEYDGKDEDHDYEERKGETKESDQGMWKTRVLPEEDIKRHSICLLKHCLMGYLCLLME